MKRVLTIGDIHGCYTSFAAILDLINLAPEDTLITLGDYIDRGPDSKKVIAKLIELEKTHKLVALRGNHEILLIEAIKDRQMMQRWCRPEYGGSSTIMSYGTHELSEFPPEHLNFIYKTQRYYETAEHIFVHASLSPELELIDQRGSVLFWERFGEAGPHKSGKTMICGHSTQSSGIPKSIGHAICIDTCVFAGGWLTCLEPFTGKYWQANERGERREGNLSDLA